VPPRPANLHIDTGFVGHLQLVDSDASPFRPPARGWRSVGAGVQGETHGRLASVASVGIAGGTIDRVPTIFSRGDAASGRHGRLGASLLARFAYTIDLPSERLLLEPRADSFVTPAQGFVGMTVTPVAEGARVRYVQPGSPAEHAGFTSGDRIVSIDGVATAGLTRRDLAEKLQVDAGRRLEVCRRDGASVECRGVVAGDLGQPPS
jgi:S1-C subfamily serine protease